MDLENPLSRFNSVAYGRKYHKPVCRGVQLPKLAKIFAAAAFAVLSAVSAFANSDPEPKIEAPNFKGSENWKLVIADQPQNYKGDENFHAAYVSDQYVGGWEMKSLDGEQHYMEQCAGTDDGECIALYCTDEGQMMFATTDYANNKSVLRFWQFNPKEKTKTPMTLISTRHDPLMSQKMYLPMVKVALQAVLFEFEAEGNNFMGDGTLDFSYSSPNAVDVTTVNKIQSFIFSPSHEYDMWATLIS